MIAFYDGRCFICGDETKKAVDQYDPHRKVYYHQACYDSVIHIDEPASEQAERLAIKLGYR